MPRRWENVAVGAPPCPNSWEGSITVHDPHPELGVLKIDPTAEQCPVCGGYHIDKAILTGRRH